MFVDSVISIKVELNINKEKFSREEKNLNDFHLGYFRTELLQDSRLYLSNKLNRFFNRTLSNLIEL